MPHRIDPFRDTEPANILEPPKLKVGRVIEMKRITVEAALELKSKGKDFECYYRGNSSIYDVKNIEEWNYPNKGRYTLWFDDGKNLVVQGDDVVWITEETYRMING